MSFKDFAKGASVMGLALVLTGLANLMILPVVTRTLGTYQYGIWIEISVTVMLLTPVAVLGQSLTMLRFLPSMTDVSELRNEFFTSFFFVGLLGLVITAVLIMISSVIATHFFHDQATLLPIVLAAFIVPVSALNALTTSFFRSTGHINIFASLTVLLALGQLVLILGLLSYGLELVGVVLGTLITNTVVFGIAMALIVSKIGICWPKYHVLRKNLKFGLPLVPNSLVSWVTDSSDRYLVGLILGLSLAGIYSAAYGIGSIIFLIIAPIQVVLYPTISRLYDANEIDEVRSYMGRSIRYFLILAIPAVAGISILSESLLVALTTADFASGAVVIPLVALAGLLAGVTQIIVNVTFLVKKTYLTFLIFMTPALANILLVLILTPLLGIAGTAMATTLAYVALLAIGARVSFRYLRLTFEWSFIGRCAASTLPMMAVIALIDPVGLYQIFASIGVGILVYTVSLVLTKAITMEELRVVRDIVLDMIVRGRSDRG